MQHHILMPFNMHFETLSNIFEGSSNCSYMTQRENSFPFTKLNHLEIVSYRRSWQHVLLVNVLYLVMLASYLADFDTRWPHEYEILNFARFSSRIWKKKPILSRRIQEAYRWSHDGHANSSRLYPSTHEEYRNR